MTLERRAPLARKAPMKQGAPLARGAGLARKAPMKQGTSLARGAAPIARTAPAPVEPKPRAPLVRKPAAKRRAPVNTGASQAQRALVFERDRGRCVRCGIDLTSGSVGYNDHHRQGRGMGGRQGEARAAANLAARRLTLCGSGSTGCHGWVTEHPEPAERAGMVVRRGGGIDPATVPVLTWAGWMMLDDVGGAVPCPAPPEDDARSLARV